jgi:AcrR family transcriptional regulator
MASSTKEAQPKIAGDRRQRRRKELRERLFRAALDLFANKGFTETTVEDITNAADVGKGTFFNYFPTKEHILVAFSDMQVARLQHVVSTVCESTEPMSQFFRTLTFRMTEEPAPSVVRAILQANLSGSSVRNAMRVSHSRMHGLLTELVRAGQKRGEFRRDIPAKELAHVFRQTIFGTLLMWSVYEDGPLRERINTALNVLWMGLAPRRSSDSRAQRTSHAQAARKRRL